MRIKNVKKHVFINAKNVGIFSAFSVSAFVITAVFAPINASDAETVNASATTPAYVASISVDSTTSISVNPTSSQSIYTETSEISYTNTCPAGFMISLSSASEDTNLTRIGEDEALKTIPTIESGTTLSDNTWGYSTDNGETYNAFPALSNPVNILNTSSANTDPATLNLTYGLKTDNNLPSGRYTNSAVYTIVVKPECLTYGVTWDFDDGIANSSATYPTALNFSQTIDLTALTPTREGYEFKGWSNGDDDFTGEETNVNINPENLTSITMTAQWEEVADPMQGFNSLSLASGESVRLKDLRDGEIYTVKKLADGNVWMTQNLRLINKEISSADSNLPSGDTWTVPASSIEGFSEQNANNAYLDDTYGGYYTFYTATAGWGTNSVSSGSSPKDICPKGWRMPTNSEYQTLYSNYNSSASLQDAPGFILSGRITSSGQSAATFGYYWSSTSFNASYGYHFYINGSSASAGRGLGKYEGYSVRCIAKEPTMQTFESSFLANVGDSVQLRDERDDNIYTVKKLADGNVWMTQNLRLIDITISDADSNLPSGDTWVIPASSTAGFSPQSTTYNAYLDSTYGGFYTYYIATAGWGMNSVSSGVAAKDICPKGWRLPTGDPNGEFQTLYNNYNSTTLMQGVPGFVLSGYVYNGLDREHGLSGGYWSATVYSTDYAYSLYMDSTGVYPASDGNYKYMGLSVRCLAK